VLPLDELYLDEGRPTYCYNLLGIARFKASADCAFSGRIEWVQIDIDEAEDPDHMISPEGACGSRWRGSRDSVIQPGRQATNTTKGAG